MSGVGELLASGLPTEDLRTRPARQYSGAVPRLRLGWRHTAFGSDVERAFHRPSGVHCGRSCREPVWDAGEVTNGRHIVCAYPWIDHMAKRRPALIQNRDVAKLNDWCLVGRIAVSAHRGNEVLLHEGPDARGEVPVVAYSK